MIFKAIKETLGQVFHSPEASGTWGTDDVKLPFWDDADIECAIDEEVVDCSEMDSPPYIGVPAPAYLEDDEWFGPAPVKTEKQEAYIQIEEATERLHEDMRKESGKVESENIHEELYLTNRVVLNFYLFVFYFLAEDSDHNNLLDYLF